MAEDQELGSLANSRHTGGGGTFSDIGVNRYQLEDEHTLARLGKKQVLKRRFGFLSLFGFSCTILITWETVLASVSSLLLRFRHSWLTAQKDCFSNRYPSVCGGPVGLVYGFLFAWFCTLSVYMCIAEMASLAPIAGGQYFWVSILAPKRYARFLSYITGWLTSIAWLAVLAIESIFVAQMIQGLLVLNYPTYENHAYHATFLSWAVIALSVFINTVVSGLLPMFEGIILIFHVLGFLAILVTVLYTAPHGTAASVFTKSLNEGNWPTQGLSYCVGFIGNVATFVGADASVHMSEEIENAALNVPRAIFITMILNGSTGFAMVLVVLFCIGDIDAVLDTPTKFPFIQLFYNATKSYAGTTVMVALVLALSWCATIGFSATASRMTWSFARDRGVPFHKIISKVERRTSIPVIAVAIVTIIPCLLALIYIFSTTVFENVVSLTVSGLYASYFIPCALLLWRRTTGQIHDRFSNNAYDNEQPIHTPHVVNKQARKEGTIDDKNDMDEVVQPRLVWGPWRVPGIWGTINNAFACVYIIFVLFWSFWPPDYPATPVNMNYSVLMTGAAIGFSIIYYYIWGKDQYRGPLIEYEVRDIAR